MTRGHCTAGIDIGTSSVKALVVDDDGTVVRAARVPHAFSVPAPLRFQHDARVAWLEGPLAALAALGDDVALAGASVAAMVPSLTAVDGSGVPCAPGLLYGDERGHKDSAPDGARAGTVVEAGELGRFLEWLVAAAPDARGYW